VVFPILLRTVDGLQLNAEHLPYAPRDGVVGDPGLGIVLAHGFTGALHKPTFRTIATQLSAYGGVVSFDFRGHGASGGSSTVGDAEVLDLDAAVAATREFGYQRVVTVGFSMGGAVAIRHAALRGVRTLSPPDGVVTLSAVSRWYRMMSFLTQRPALKVVRAVGVWVGGFSFCVGQQVEGVGTAGE